MPLPTRAQVVVVGAGLAGLSVAVRLRAAGVDVHVAEAAGHAGGRLATERVDGFVVDRGFQVLNTGYPRAADLDLAALDLGWFWPGAVVQVDGRASRVVDPRRRPAAALDTVRAPLGSPLRKAAIAAYSARAGYTPVPRLVGEGERPAEERLRRAGVGDTAVERFFRPFLAGVLLEDRLETSSRYLDLLWRSFARGAIGLPARGMQAMGEQLADRVGAERVHLGVGVTAVGGDAVSTDAGRTRAEAVVVASDPDTAAALVPGLTASAPRQVTTHLHVLPSSPTGEPLLVLGTPGGRLVNSAVLTDAQPAYSPDGRALVASSSLAPTPEPDVRAEAAALHGTGRGVLRPLPSVPGRQPHPAAVPPLCLRQPVDLG